MPIGALYYLPDREDFGISKPAQLKILPIGKIGANSAMHAAFLPDRED